MRRARIPFLWLLIFLLAMLLLTAGGRLAPLDDETAFEMTANLLERGALTIDHQTVMLPVQTFPGFLPHAQPSELQTTWAMTGRDGQLYPQYSYGVAVLNAPLYLLGRALGGGETTMLSVAVLRKTVSMLNPIMLALTGWLIALFAARLGFSTRLSIGLALAYSLCTLALAYGHTFFSEPTLGLLITLAAYALYADRCAEVHHLRWLMLAGGSLGLMLYVRERTAILLPAFISYIFIARLAWRFKHWLVFLTPIVLAGGLIALANTVRFGSPLMSGYQFQNSTFNTPLLVGLYGLLISPGKGLLLYSPMVWAGLFGLIGWLRRRSPEALLLTLLVLIEVVFYSVYDFWTGGWNWGPRYLLPIVPLLVLAAGAWVTAHPTDLRRSILIVLSVIGLLINLPAVFVDHSRYLADFGERDPAHYIDRSILNLADSPLVQQWPTTIDLLGRYTRSETWQAAQAVVTERVTDYQGDKSVVALSTPLMLIDEFFRYNVPDFWFVHLVLLGFSPIMIGLVVTVLVLILVVSGRRLWLSLS